jgi:Chaperone of endosialidase
MPPSSNYFEFGVDKIGATLSTHALALDAVIKSDTHNIILQSGSGASAVYIKTDNKVGIANSAPSEALDVTGFAHASSGYKTGSYGMVIDSSGNLTGLNGNLTGNLTVDTDTLFVHSTNSNIGIGTTSPEVAYKLHVVGDTRIEGNIIVNGTSTVINTGVQNTERLEITNDGTGPAVIIKQIGAQQILKVLDDANVCFLIEDNGHVLVGGAANGNYQFDVSGNAHYINNVDISGNTDISGNINIGGNAKVVSNMSIVGNVGVASDFDLSGNFRILTNKFVVTAASGNTGLAGTLDVSNNFNVNINKFTIAASSGNTGLAGTLDVSNNFNVNINKFTIDASSGNTGLAGTLDVSNNFNVNINKFTIDASSGNTGLAGTLDVSNNFNVNINKFTIAASSGNTGLAGTLDVSNNFNVNINKFTIAASSGNTGLAGTLDVSNNFNVNTDKFTVAAATGNTIIAGTLALAGNLAIDTDVFFVDVSNNMIGINDSTPQFELDVSGNIATNNAIMFNSSTDGAFAHRSNNTSTNFALLQSTAGKTIINCKAGAGNIEFKHGDGTVKQQFDSSGNVIIQGNLFSYSDARIKTNVETIPNALNKVLSLRGVTYNMIKDVENDPDNAPKHIGVIAQEVEAVIPEAVKEENGIKTVAYGNIVGLLIEAIKEIKDQMNK